MSKKKPPARPVLRPVDLGRVAQWHVLTGDAPAVAAPPSLLGAWSDWARLKVTAETPSTRLEWAEPGSPPEADHYVIVGVYDLDCDHERRNVREHGLDARECPTCVAASVELGWTARVELAASVRWPEDLDLHDGDPDDYTEWQPPAARAAVVDSPRDGGVDELPDEQARAALAIRLEAVLDPMAPAGDVGVRLRRDGPWAALVCLVSALETAAALRRGGVA